MRARRRLELVGATGTRNATLSYDPLGRLWEVTSAGNTTRFLYDGDELVAEYNAAGALLRRYMHGPGTDEPIVADEGGALNCSGTKVLHSDRQGSIIATADCWGGRQAINAYDEYGTPAAGNAAISAGGRFGYTGQAWVPELELWYYKARFYSGPLGRFLQVDPIGYDDQINLYAYVGNDPLQFTDPTGQRRFAWIVELTKTGMRKIRGLNDKRHAVEARRRGQHLISPTRQRSESIDAAAFPGGKRIRHSGHELEDGAKGKPHVQTEGQQGHSFYGTLSAIGGAVLTAIEVLDQATNPFNEAGLSECQTLGACGPMPDENVRLTDGTPPAERNQNEQTEGGSWSIEDGRITGSRGSGSRIPSCRQQDGKEICE